MSYNARWWAETMRCPKCRTRIVNYIHKMGGYFADVGGKSVKCADGSQGRYWHEHVKACCPEYLKPKAVFPELKLIDGPDINNGNKIWDVYSELHQKISTKFPKLSAPPGHEIRYSHHASRLIPSPDIVYNLKIGTYTYYLCVRTNCELEGEVVVKDPTEVWFNDWTTNSKESARITMIKGWEEQIISMIPKFMADKEKNAAERDKARASRKARLLRDGDHLIYILSCIEEQIGECESSNLTRTRLAIAMHDKIRVDVKVDRIVNADQKFGKLYVEISTRNLQSSRMIGSVTYGWAINEDHANPSFNPSEYAAKLVSAINSTLSTIRLVNAELQK